MLLCKPRLLLNCTAAASHFWLTLHVAMQLGLYLHLLVIGTWHVVSEGSHFRQLAERAFPADCLHRMDCHAHAYHRILRVSSI